MKVVGFGKKTPVLLGGAKRAFSGMLFALVSLAVMPVNAADTPLPADNTVRYIVPTRAFPTGLDTTNTLKHPVAEHDGHHRAGAHGKRRLRRLHQRGAIVNASVPVVESQNNEGVDPDNHLPVKSVQGNPISAKRHALHSMKTSK